MSTGFRLFLLTVLVFGAIWLSKRRADDILFWLRAPRGVEETLREFENAPVTGVRSPRVDVSLVPPEPPARPPSPEPRRPPPGGLLAGEVQPPGPRGVSGARRGSGVDGGPAGRARPPQGGRPRGGRRRPAPPSAGEGGADREPPPPAREPAGPRRGPPSGPAADSSVDGPDDPGTGPGPGGAGETSDEPSGEPAGRTYVVRSGDTLSEISQAELGTATRWREIEELNRELLEESPFLQPGMELRLPAD